MAPGIERTTPSTTPLGSRCTGRPAASVGAATPPPRGAGVPDLSPGPKLGSGPALLDVPRFGFFYAVIAPRPLTGGDLPAIEGRMRELVQRGLAYRREEAPKAAVLRLFAERGEPLKGELIEDKGGEPVSVYRIDGNQFVAFCT